jgi:hypothetical protein
MDNSCNSKQLKIVTLHPQKKELANLDVTTSAPSIDLPFALINGCSGLQEGKIDKASREDIDTSRNWEADTMKQ